MASELFQYLQDAYQGARRHKATGAARCICVDDRKEHERCHEFCTMFVRISPDDLVTVHINHLPVDEHVLKCLSKLQASIEELNGGNRIEFVLSASSSRRLHHLTTAVRRVAGRGRRYSKRNWKWIAPRASGSLGRLADVLDDFNLLAAG